MGYFADAKKLVYHAKVDLKAIEQEYRASISANEVKDTLLVSIKNFMENLRSALDYTAHGLFDKYGTKRAKKRKIYFPYAPLNQTREAFKKGRRIENCIPGVSANRSDIVSKIESYQHFSDKKNEWLPIFMELNNKNKHQQLLPQVRKERKELRISSGNARISLGQNAKIRLGRGASIRFGGLVVRGGQTIGVNNMPRIQGKGNVELIKWVSFHFKFRDLPVIPFLRKALDGVQAIVNELAVS